MAIKAFYFICVLTAYGNHFAGIAFIAMQSVYQLLNPDICSWEQNNFIIIDKNVLFTVVPSKSDSDVIFCLQLLSKTLTCTHHLS